MSFGLTISGTSYQILAGTLQIQNSIGRRSTGQVIIHTDNMTRFAVNQPVEITDDGGIAVFTGFIAGVIDVKPGFQSTLNHTITLKDNHYCADKRIAAVAYTNQTCQYIIQDLVSQILSHEAIYFSASNLLTPNQANADTDTTGFTAVNSATLAYSTAQHWQGSGSIAVTCNGVGGNRQGVAAVQPSTIYANGAPYTVSAYVYSAAGVTVQCSLMRLDTLAALGSITTATIPAGVWTRVTATGTTPTPVVTTSYGIRIDIPVGTATTFYVDGLQIENGNTANAWVVGNTTSIAAGITVPQLTANYVPVSDILNALAAQSNYYWQIDQFRTLWFQPYTAIPGPGVDGSTFDQRQTVSLEYRNDNYRNKQYIVGGTAETSSQTETRKGDGNIQAFTMSYPLAHVPTITVNGTAKTVGIKGVDSGKDWYWASGDAVIAQDSAATKLISTDTLSVTYTGQYPIVIESEDDSQIGMLADLEQITSGIVEAVQVDTTIATANAGLVLAANLLQRYGIAGQMLTFWTRDNTIAPGQIITVTLPDYGLTDELFLVESVNISDNDGVNIWFQIQAVQGPYDNTWVDFYNAIASKNTQMLNAINLGKSNVVQSLQQFTASITAPICSVNPVPYACPLPNTTLQPNTTLYPC